MTSVSLGVNPECLKTMLSFSCSFEKMTPEEQYMSILSDIGNFISHSLKVNLPIERIYAKSDDKFFVTGLHESSRERVHTEMDFLIRNGYTNNELDELHLVLGFYRTITVNSSVTFFLTEEKASLLGLLDKIKQTTPLDIDIDQRDIEIIVRSMRWVVGDCAAFDNRGLEIDESKFEDFDVKYVGVLQTVSFMSKIFEARVPEMPKEDEISYNVYDELLLLKHHREVQSRRIKANVQLDLQIQNTNKSGPFIAECIKHVNPNDWWIFGLTGKVFDVDPTPKEKKKIHKFYAGIKFETLSVSKEDCDKMKNYNPDVKKKKGKKSKGKSFQNFIFPNVKGLEGTKDKIIEVTRFEILEDGAQSTLQEASSETYKIKDDYRRDLHRAKCKLSNVKKKYKKFLEKKREEEEEEPIGPDLGEDVKDYSSYEIEIEKAQKLYEGYKTIEVEDLCYVQMFFSIYGGTPSEVQNIAVASMTSHFKLFETKYTKQILSKFKPRNKVVTYVPVRMICHKAKVSGKYTDMHNHTTSGNVLSREWEHDAVIKIKKFETDHIFVELMHVRQSKER
jgi:hypothetical protein